MAKNNYLSIPELILKADVLSTDSTFKLQNIVWYIGSDGVAVNLSAGDFGTSGIGYGCFDERTGSQEFFTWDTSTIANATTTGITILSRGLPWGSDYTTSASTRKFFHGSGSKVLLFTNAPAFYNTFLNKANDETITGTYTFPNDGQNPLIGASYIAPTNDLHVATKKYIDDVALASAPNATTTVKGVVEIATGAELAAGTGTGGTGAVIVAAGSSFKNSSAGAGDANKVPVLNASGQLDQSFMPAPFSATAANIQVTTDASSDNDVIRKAYLDAYVVQDIFGDGSDGNVTLGGNTTITRDMYYNNLTIPLTYTLNTDGYRVYVKGTLTRSGTGYIYNNGGNGGNGGDGSSAGSGTGGTAGTAGAVAHGYTVPSGAVGKIGIAGLGTAGSVSNYSSAGSNGTAGDSYTISGASSGTAGGGGGNANDGAGHSASGGTGGTAGTATVSPSVPRNAFTASNLIVLSGTSTTTFIMPAAGAGSGATGAIAVGGTSTQVGSAGSGGSGGSGGYVVVFARTIVDSGSGTMFQAKGGNGGNGGTPYASQTTTAIAVGGAGGGAAGNGGVIIRVYNKLTGTAATDVTPGTKGTGGGKIAGGTGTSTVGSDGSVGASGAVYDIIV